MNTALVWRASNISLTEQSNIFFHVWPPPQQTTKALHEEEFKSRQQRVESAAAAHQDGGLSDSGGTLGSSSLSLMASFPRAVSRKTTPAEQGAGGDVMPHAAAALSPPTVTMTYNQEKSTFETSSPPNHPQLDFPIGESR